MKKLVAIIAVLALAAPICAQNVAIDLAHEGNGVVRVDYNASGAVQDVSGFGLLISLDAGTISAISDFKEGESTSGDPGYGIYPGSVDIDTSGQDPVVNSWGTPIDLTNAPGTGIGESSMYIAMGTLYDEEPNKPGATGTLFKFTIDCGAHTGAVNISVTGDSDRAGDVGGIVLADGSNTAITVTGDTQVTCPFGAGDCPVDGTQAQKDLWNTLGQPANWCGDCWLCGDVDGNCDVTFGDVLAVFSYRDLADPNGDINMSGEVTFGDVLDVFTLRNAGGCASNPVCQPCTPLP